MHWYELQDMMFLVKCFKNPLDNLIIRDYVEFVTSTTRASSNGKLRHKFCRLPTPRYFYFNRIVRLWNLFPQIDLSLSLPSIKPFVVQLLLKLLTPTMYVLFICCAHAPSVNCNYPCINILVYINISSATPVVGVSLSACNDLYHLSFTKSLISPLTQCCTGVEWTYT